MSVSMRAQTLLTTTVRSDASYSSNDVFPSRRNSNPPAVHFLSVPKPSWIVRTESNVRREQRKKPDPSCVICLGSGRLDCHHCRGRGRTNCVHEEMLPMGEWPKWCKECGGSGLGYCSRCLGTGEYRYIMGFQFMKRELYDNQQALTLKTQTAPPPHLPKCSQTNSLTLEKNSQDAVLKGGELHKDTHFLTDDYFL